MGPLLGGALGITLVSLTDTISTASAFAARSGDEIDGNREMIGIGAANIAAGFFQGFPVSTSGSRTAVAEQNGPKTQVTGLVGALAITLILLAVPGLLRNLPQPTLAAVVIAASVSLADIPATRRLYHVRRTDFLLSIAAFLGVVLLGVPATTTSAPTPTPSNFRDASSSGSTRHCSSRTRGRSAIR
jgi:MFS superfamily sulfate permease-like transporter